MVRWVARCVVVWWTALGSGVKRCSDKVCGKGCLDWKCSKSMIAESCAGVGAACRRLEQNRAVIGLLGLKAKNRQGRCAVVSSSDAMLRHKLGSVIDSFDEVYRVNMSPLRGFEKAVGAKTTFCVTNTPSWLSAKDMSPETLRRDYFSRENGSSRPVVFVQDPLMAADHVKCGYRHTVTAFRRRVATAFKSCKRALKPTFECRVLPARIVETAWHAICNASLKHEPKLAPSSGLIVVVLAAASCRSVAIFGFDHPASSAHYYDTRRTIGPELHSHLESHIFHIWQAAFPGRFTVVAGWNAQTSTLKPAPPPWDAVLDAARPPTPPTTKTKSTTNDRHQRPPKSPAAAPGGKTPTPTTTSRRAPPASSSA